MLRSRVFVENLTSKYNFTLNVNNLMSPHLNKKGVTPKICLVEKLADFIPCILEFSCYSETELLTRFRPLSRFYKF